MLFGTGKTNCDSLYIKPRSAYGALGAWDRFQNVVGAVELAVGVYKLEGEDKVVLSDGSNLDTNTDLVWVRS